ncbi:ribosomal RNA-processing protein 7 A-like [Sarcoptes scabiei]|nr:ribosomal RNA-processing protein 7 A-like [Sarcoptes scabiei]
MEIKFWSKLKHLIRLNKLQSLRDDLDVFFFFTSILYTIIIESDGRRSTTIIASTINKNPFFIVGWRSSSTSSTFNIISTLVNHQRNLNTNQIIHSDIEEGEKKKY